MNKIDQFVKETLEELELLGLDSMSVTNTVHHDYENEKYSLSSNGHLGNEMLMSLHISGDHVLFTFYVSKEILFLFRVLQGQDLNEYINKLGYSLFLRLRSILLKRVKRSKNLQKIEGLVDVLKSRSEIEYFRMDRTTILGEIAIDYIVN